MKPRLRPSLATAGPLALALALAPVGRAEEKSRPEDRWPGWRGFGQGVAGDASLPLE